MGGGEEEAGGDDGEVVYLYARFICFDELTQGVCDGVVSDNTLLSVSISRLH